MRNLRKHLSVMLVVAMIFTMMAPVFAVSSSYQANYEDEAEVLYDLGLFKGVSEDEFDPDLGSSLTREQAAIILLRLFGQEQEAEKMSAAEVRSALARFTDANDISSWARKQVAYATSKGIIKGFETGEFRPQGNITGKQYASLLLQEIGADFEYEGAIDTLAELGVVSMAQMIEFDRDLLRDDVVCMSYNILDVDMENEDGEVLTVIENLIENGVVDRDLAEEYDLVEPIEEEPGDVEEPVKEEPGDVEEPVKETEIANVEYAPTSSRTLSVGQNLFKVATVTVTAGNEDINVTGLKLQKTGMCDDAYISNITVWRGSEKLNTVGRFNSGLANIAFTKLVTVEAGESVDLDVKVNIKDTTLEGTPEFNIALAEVKADAEVEGNFPMAGNTFTISKVKLGTMTVTVSGDAPTGTLNAGDEDVRLAKFDIAFEKEAQVLKQVKLTQNGSISDSDIANLKLVDDKGVVATADGLENGTVTFKFEKEYESGTTARLTLRGDVIGGAGRTIKFEINDENDIQSKGKVYGTTVASTVNIEDDQYPTLTIGRGSLILSKAESSPVSATIAKDCENQRFTTIKIEAVGEPVQIDTVVLKIEAKNEEDMKKIDKIKVSSGDIVLASQSDVYSNLSKVNNVVKNELELSLSEIITVNPGTPVELDIAADIKSASQDSSYQLGICEVKGTGLISAKDVKNTVNVLGSKMTVGDVKLTVEEVAGVKSYIFPNQASKELTSFELYHNLGEDVKVSSIAVKLTAKDVADADERDAAVYRTFSNIRLVTEDGKVVSDPINTPDKEQLTISLKDGVVVSAGQTVRLSLIADIKSTAAKDDGNPEFGFVVVAKDIDGSGAAVTAVTMASGTTVEAKEIDATRVIVVSPSVAENNIDANYSVTGDLENKNVVANKEKNQTNLVKLAQWTLTNKSNETVNVNKVYLTAKYGYNQEGVTNRDLSEAYINKYSLKDGKGNTLATFSTLPNGNTCKEITLTKKLEIPAQENNKNGEAELVVWANIEKGAQYGGTVSVALGNGEGKYCEITGTVSGETRTCSFGGGANLEASEDGVTPLKNTVAISKVTASNVSISTSVEPGAGITVGKFRLTNSGNEAVDMKNIRVIVNQNTSKGDKEAANTNTNDITNLSLYDEKGLIGGYDSTAAEPNADLGKIDNENKVNLAITNGKKIAAGSSEVFEIRLGNGKLEEGEIIELRLDDEGTTYDSTSKTDNGYAISIDNYVTLDKVQAKNN